MLIFFATFVLRLFLHQSYRLQSIVTRLRIIVTNFRNILTHLIWLLGLFILNSLTYVQLDSALWPRALVFWLFGRGLVDLLCWFWVNDDAPKSARRRAQSSSPLNPSLFAFRRSSMGADVNVNKSLQKEMTVRVLSEPRQLLQLNANSRAYV